jgi:CDP-glucose 4,6-dehydratase
MNDFWHGRTALVTGATGLLGSWLVPALERRGARVVIVVRDLVPDSLLRTNGAADRCVTVLGDVTDGRLLERVLVEHEVDAVFHLAAQTQVEHALRDPVGTFESNVKGTWEVLDACRRSRRPQRIVVASSDKAYGAQPELPYTEGTPLEGRHPYDVSKSCTDLIAQSYALSYELPIVVTRCGNLYGGGDLNFNRLVPGVIRDAYEGRRPALRSDGAPIRDYLYVEDAAEAYIMLAERAHEPGVAAEAWNFSIETQLTAAEMARRVLAACGREDLELDIRGTATHEILHQYLSAEKARTRLGWQAAYGLDEGLRRSAEWYHEYFRAADAERAAL